MRRENYAVTVIGAAFLLVCVACGCGDRSDKSIFSAVGSYGDVAVLTSDPGLYQAVVPFLNRLAPTFEFGVKKESLYRYHNYSGGDWKSGRNYRNILIFARRDDDGDVADEIRSMLSESVWQRLASDHGEAVVLHDTYFQNQLVIVAVAPQTNLLASLLHKKAPALADTLHRDISRRQRADNRRTGLGNQPERDRARFGFSMEIPAAFDDVLSQPGGFPGIYWRRINPEGSGLGLSVAWLQTPDPAALMSDHSELLALRKHIAADLQDGAVIQDDMPEWIVWNEVPFLGRTAVWLRGNLYYEGNMRGGPFWSYFLAAPNQERLYCLDAWVYNPANKSLKMDDFRHLRSVLETFIQEAPTP